MDAQARCPRVEKPALRESAQSLDLAQNCRKGWGVGASEAASTMLLRKRCPRGTHLGVSGRIRKLLLEESLVYLTRPKRRTHGGTGARLRECSG